MKWVQVEARRCYRTSDGRWELRLHRGANGVWPGLWYLRDVQNPDHQAVALNINTLPAAKLRAARYVESNSGNPGAAAGAGDAPS